MSKSSFLNNKKLSKSDIAIFSILLMIAGLLISRLFLSLGMVMFGINALWNVPPKKWLQHKWWLLGVAWVAIYALTWFWSDDKETWGTMLQLKLPVLLLPLAFAFLPRFSAQQLQLLTIGVALMLLAGVAYSLSFLVRDYAHIVQEYNVSHVLPTPVYKDYICFSTTCSLFIIWSVYFLPQITKKWAKWLIGITIAILTVYIHILASKSGLVAFYLFIFGWAFYTVFTKKNVVGIITLVAIPLFLIAAVKYIPTLHERKEHIVYSYYVFMADDKENAARLGDLSRISSYDIALKLIAQNPLKGVGTGDMQTEMNVGYTKWYPYITESMNKLIPHNQFLTVALGCGIPALFVFCWWVCTPLFWLRRNRQSFFMFTVWLALLCQLMIEPFLESQFGVFIYIFFLLLFRHILPPRSENKSPQV